MPAAGAIVVEHNRTESRFETRVDGRLCLVVYRLVGHTMWLTHTEVPTPLRGQGIAAQLVVAALQAALAERWQVRPACSYVEAYLRRHPEWQQRLAAAGGSGAD
jgi:predicted GNAT family acetyltransferase